MDGRITIVACLFACVGVACAKPPPPRPPLQQVPIGTTGRLIGPAELSPSAGGPTPGGTVPANYGMGDPGGALVDPSLVDSKGGGSRSTTSSSPAGALDP